MAEITILFQKKKYKATQLAPQYGARTNDCNANLYSLNYISSFASLFLDRSDR